MRQRLPGIRLSAASSATPGSPCSRFRCSRCAYARDADHAKLKYHLPVPNAARILARMGIKFELRDYQVDEEDLSAENVAGKVGLPHDQVWKTLVARGDRTGVLLAVLAGSATLDLKSLAKLSGNRKTETVPLKEVQPLTGYVRGGVTAIGGKKDYPVFVDETIEAFDRVAVPAGVRGTQIVLTPGDYLRASGATVMSARKSRLSAVAEMACLRTASLAACKA